MIHVHHQILQHVQADSDRRPLGKRRPHKKYEKLVRASVLGHTLSIADQY